MYRTEKQKWKKNYRRKSTQTENLSLSLPRTVFNDRGQINSADQLFPTYDGYEHYTLLLTENTYNSKNISVGRKLDVDRWRS